MTLTILIGALAVFLTVIRVLGRGDMRPVTRLAWILVLIIFPLIGVLIYFLFGEVNLGHVANIKAKDLYAKIEAAKSKLQALPHADGRLDPHYKPAFDFARSINGFFPVGGNKVELLADAATARARLIQDIDEAQSSVNVLYYIWHTDKTGTDVANALMRAASRGVVCRAMADGLGSRDIIHAPLWKEMSRAGVQTSIALPFSNVFKTVLTSRLDLRNHRKITVIDDIITYCGSQNCTDPEFHTKPKFAPWIDILLRFEGPVAAQNQLLFASDWLIYEAGDVEDFIASPDLFAETEDGVIAQVWGDGPTIRAASTPQMFATLIAQAREKLTISTPYFVPGDVVLAALCAAAYRGVQVRLIFPARNDSWIVGAASRSHYKEMLEAGVEIYEYNGGLLHSKTLSLDGQVSLIGSSNLDLRSFDLNYENNIMLHDKALTKAILQRQDEYIAQATPITQAVLDDWSIFRRIWQNIIATIGPIL